MWDRSERMLPTTISDLDRRSSPTGLPSPRSLLRKWRRLSSLQRTLLTGIVVCCITGGGLLAKRSSVSTTSGSVIVRSGHDSTNELASPQGKLLPADDYGNPIDVDSISRPPVAQKKYTFAGPQNDRQRAVVAAMKHAWSNYKKYAWGADHLKPISKSKHNWFNLALTITDSLDTLLIMGMHEEFEEAKNYVLENVQFDRDQYVNTFETTIRALGGLLSTYHLTGDQQLLDKARDLGDRLLTAYNTPFRVPYSDVNLGKRKAKSPAWASESSLSEATTVQLEMRDLSRATGLTKYETMAFNASQHIHNIGSGCEKFDGLCPMFINPKTGNWKPGTTITMGARADSYYEYLLKQWLQTGKTIPWLKADYEQAMAGMIKHLVRYSGNNNFAFVGELLGGSDKYYAKMDHLTCFIAGTLALGAVNGVSLDHMDLAHALAHTCWQMYDQTPTKLAPEIAHFNMLPGTNNPDLFIKPLDAHCLLRPEAIESWFYMYRLTGNLTYQEYGWTAFQGIEKHARVANGYSSVSNVKKIPVQYRDMMESFFLAETLKYLYLLFDDTKQVIPLEQFVFNTEAHPLPIYRN